MYNYIPMQDLKTMRHMQHVNTNPFFVRVALPVALAVVLSIASFAANV